MSIYPLARVWDHSQQRGSALLLLLAMADRADELGVCWAGTNWLASRARLERRQTFRTVQQLESAKEVIIVRSRRPTGQNVVNHYIVSVGASPDVLHAAHLRVRELLSLRGSVAYDTSVTQDTREGGADDTRGSGQQDTRVVAGMTPDPYSYPEEKEGHLLSPSELWSLALDELELQTTRATFRSHFAQTTATGQGDELVITARAISHDWLATRYSDLIQRTVDDLAGRPITIRFEAK